MHVLIVGGGSIGKRHLKNLNDLGVDQISLVDPDQKRWTEARQLVRGVRCYQRLGVGDEEGVIYSIDAVVIATPPATHVSIAREILEAVDQIPLFIEKPLGHNLDGVSMLEMELKECDTWAVIGYHMRFHPAIQEIKRILSTGEIGQPLYVRAEIGQYLPDWHPGEDYRNWYMAKEEEGGGALLDLSHEIDYLMYLFGDLTAPQGITTKISALDITSDDVADFMLMYRHGGLLASIHMDLLDREYNRRCRIIGSEGTINWDINNHSVTWMGKSYTYGGNINIPYRDEMKAFIESVKSGVIDPRFATLEDGKKVLEVVLDLKQQCGRG